MNETGYTADNGIARVKTDGTPREAQALDERSPDLDAQRVEHALRRFQESWPTRVDDPGGIDQALDDLDTAVGLWLTAARTEG